MQSKIPMSFTSPGTQAAEIWQQAMHRNLGQTNMLNQHELQPETPSELGQKQSTILVVLLSLSLRKS